MEHVDVDAVVAAVARRIATGLPVLTREMTEHFVEVIPEFRHDDAVRELMVSSTAANLSAIVDLLEHGIAVDGLTVPAAAAEYARRFAQRDLSLEALLRAYRLGEHRFVQWALRGLGELDLDARTVLAAAAELGARTNRYIDQVIEGLIDIYEEERRTWDARSDAARAATIRAVLAASDLDVGAAEETLGAPLRGWHRGAVLWAPEPGPEMRAVEADLVGVAGRVPLSVLAEHDCLWVWWSATTRPAVRPAALARLTAAHPGLRVALGGSGAGLAGFRTSHREAWRARALAELRPDGPAVVDYDEVALPALLAEHHEDLQAWLRRTLGGLAAGDEATGRLRETLHAYLAADRSSSEAAGRLHLHKNTVHYRLRRAEEVLGHPVTEGRLDVEVALLVCRHLGWPPVDPVAQASTAASAGQAGDAAVVIARRAATSVTAASSAKTGAAATPSAARTAGWSSR
ncbi:PucR family transcriptional regulator [Actinomycetospora sp. CA-084318]|uniref:PucR family transcriptional regulator n=1 Tax=Actinomycetospora sp. CA-084318 TaxID=3239892 RepID=UPI003D96D070